MAILLERWPGSSLTVHRGAKGWAVVERGERPAPLFPRSGWSSKLLGELLERSTTHERSTQYSVLLVTPTREIFWNVVDGGAIYLFALAAAALLGYGIYRRMRLWRLGGREVRP